MRKFALGLIASGALLAGCGGGDTPEPAVSDPEPTETTLPKLDEDARTAILGKVTRLARQSGADGVVSRGDKDACAELGQIAKDYADRDSYVASVAEGWYTKC